MKRKPNTGNRHSAHIQERGARRSSVARGFVYSLPIAAVLYILRRLTTTTTLLLTSFKSDDDRDRRRID